VFYLNIILKLLPGAMKVIPFRIRTNVVDRFINFMVDKYADINIINGDIIERRKNKPTIYICNHLSNVDGVILNKVLKDNNVAFMAGVKLQNNPLTNMILETMKTIPIKPNSADKEAIKKALDHLKNNGSIFIFPEGTRSRSSKMIEARSGFVLLCRLSGVEIVPVGIEGTENILPVHSNNMGKEKMNKGYVKITFGEPFKLLEKNKENKEDWKELAKNDAMIKVAKLLEKKYRGVYKI